MRTLKIILTLLSLVMLTACSEDASYRLPPQSWGDMEIVVETRPTPLRAGMNEFLVIVTTDRGRPVGDLIVSLRTKPGEDWRQAIQDGESGVYRKALLVGAGQQQLYVHLRRKSEHTVLEFPLEIQ